MVDNKEKDVNRWSYYFEYLKSDKIKKAREEYPELDKVVVKKIKSGDIPTADDIRNGLKTICVASGKILHQFVSEKTNFGTSVIKAEGRGAKDTAFQRLKRFKEWVSNPSTEEELLALTGDSLKRSAFELRKIYKRTESLSNKLDKI